MEQTTQINASHKHRVKLATLEKRNAHRGVPFLQRTGEKVALQGDPGTPGWPALLQTRLRILFQKLCDTTHAPYNSPGLSVIYFPFCRQILYGSNIYTQRMKSTAQQSTAHVEPLGAAGEKGLQSLQRDHSAPARRRGRVLGWHLGQPEATAAWAPRTAGTGATGQLCVHTTPLRWPHSRRRTRKKNGRQTVGRWLLGQ